MGWKIVPVMYIYLPRTENNTEESLQYVQGHRVKRINSVTPDHT